MKTLLKYLKGYTVESILGPLFKLLEATLELIVPLVIASIIDNGITVAKLGGEYLSTGRSHVIYMSLLLVLLGLIGFGFSVVAQYFAAKASVGAVTKLRGSLFKHIQTLSYTEIDSLGTSTLITRMTSDANQVQTGVNLGLRLLLRSPFVVFGAMIMAFVVDPDSAVTFAVVIPVLIAIVFGIMLISIPLYKKVQSRVDGVLSKTRENLSGVRVIRAFCKEDREIQEFGRKNAALTASQKFVGRISALMNPVTYVIINLAVIWLINIGAIEVNSGNLSQGELIALYNYMSQILIELIKLANLIITITKAVASAERIQKIYDIKSSLVSGAENGVNESEYAVEFSSVSLKYKNSLEPSLSGIDFKVKKGQTVGIIGGTGSGKSSLINLIPRFYDATEGKVLVDGIDVKDYDCEALLSKIAVVMQKAVLFSGTLRENMLYGNEGATDEKIMNAIKIAQAEEVVELKGGLDAKIEAGGKNLSGGQRQRLTIARALVKNPEILILDDSASALDFATEAKLRQAIRESFSDKTVFIVSQRASSIMHADQIIVLEDGEAVNIGTHEELLSSSSVYKEIYSSQFGGEVAK